MAGSHVILKPGEQLFNEGDLSDGMYIIRKGEVSVYLNRKGSKVELAQLQAGAMIGEMALFENKPRSASAKAICACEITKISKGDFVRLTKQIPKWFVTLMVALSSRLRETNQRLQDAEGNSPTSCQTLASSYRIVMLIKLLWYKEGIKVGRSWHLDLADTIAHTTQILNMPQANIEAAIKQLTQGGLISIELDDYKKKKLVITHRATLDTIIRIMKGYLDRFDATVALPKGSQKIFGLINDLANESPYDEPLITLTDLESKAAAKKFGAFAPWLSLLEQCDGFLADFQLTKTSDGNSAIKVNKKTLARVEQGFRAIECLQAA